MADELSLSEDLAQKILTTLVAHDGRCKNEMIACQYLSAIVAYLIGRQKMSVDQQNKIMKDLTEFMYYVYNDINQSQATVQPAVNPEEAFGIWSPNGE